MKKLILIITLLAMLGLSMVIVNSLTITDYTTVTLPAIFLEEGVFQSNYTGIWLNNSGNITDNVYDTMGIGNNSYLHVNYSKYSYEYNDTTSSSLYELMYNTTAGNVSANFSLSNCWGVDQVVMIRITSNYTNISDTDNVVNKLALECGSSITAWESLLNVTGASEIYSGKLYLNMPAMSRNFRFHNLSPPAYIISNISTVNVTWSYNDTLLAGTRSNHTKVNCTLLTKSVRGNNFSANMSDITSVNETVANATMLSLTTDDRVWWQIECEDLYGRAIGNSTQRIFDVDTEYWDYLEIDLSLNMTENDIRDVTNLYVDNIYANDGTSINFLSAIIIDSIVDLNVSNLISAEELMLDNVSIVDWNKLNNFTGAISVNNELNVSTDGDINMAGNLTITGTGNGSIAGHLCVDIDGQVYIAVTACQ